MGLYGILLFYWNSFGRRLKDKICHLTPEQLALVNEALKISLDLST